jgi:hypothetical protein
MRGWHLDEVYLKIDASAAWLLKMRVHAKKYGDPARRSSGSPVGSQRHSLTMTLTTAISAPAQIVNGDASMPANSAPPFVLP